MTPAEPSRASGRCGREEGFVLLDALAAMVVSAMVLAALYGLIQASARGSSSAVSAAIAAATVETTCREAALSGGLSAGDGRRPTPAGPVAWSVRMEPGPDLPPPLQLMRIDCRLDAPGARASATAFLLLAPPPGEDAPRAPLQGDER